MGGKLSDVGQGKETHTLIHGCDKNWENGHLLKIPIKLEPNNKSIRNMLCILRFNIYEEYHRTFRRK